MIQVLGLCKNFDGFPALTDLHLHVKKGSIYGLIGTNGSGKTTVINHLTGVWKQDEGTITIDGQAIYDNEPWKQRIGYIPDDLRFFAGYNLKEAGRYFSGLYPRWNQERFTQMVGQFHLDPKKKISRFSKGMQKQAAFSLVMATMPDILILDEPIDCLDPLIRKLVWKYIVEDVAERETTVLVSSHNLREMEGICDSIGILDHGHMVLERDLDELKSDIHKIQVAFRGSAPEGIYDGLNILHKESRGSVDLLIVRNRRDLVEQQIEAANPAIFDLLPLSLEEIFIYELGGETIELESLLF